MSLILAYKKNASIGFREVLLSDILPSNFIESGLGLNSVTIGDDAYFTIQNALNGGNIKLNWDLSVSLSNTLRLESNTEIVVTPNKGAVMRSNVNRPMFMNKNIVFRENSRIIDKNISFNGGIWNGNASQQSTKGSNSYGATNIFSFFGVENLHLKNHKMYTPKCYAQQSINILNGIIEDFVVDVGSGAINMDGVHFDGWCNDCRISRGEINTYDDGAGCNADDLYFHPDYFSGATTGFWTEDPCGPSSNIIFEDLHFNNSLFGVRVLSSKSRVNNIQINNLSGVTRAYSVLIDNFWQNPNAIQGSGTGNIGSITVDNNTTAVNLSGLPGLNEAKISLSCSIESLIMTNITPNTGNATLFSKLIKDNLNRNYVYGVVTLNGNPV